MCPLYYNQVVVGLEKQKDWDEGQVDLVFHALSDRTRRDIMRKVGRREQSISDLSRQYEMSFAAIQKHVTVLERASLVSKRVEGRQKLVSNNPETVRRTSELLARYERIWTERIGAIDRILDQDENEKGSEK